MKKLILISCFAPAALAAVQFDSLYGDHMVLQQGQPIPVTGTTDTPGKAISVSFGDVTVPAQVKGKKWQAVLPAQAVCAEGKPLSAKQGKDVTELADVVVGEVWIASGQSNMLFRMNQTPTGAADVAALAAPTFRFHHAQPMVHTNNAPYGEAEFKRLSSDGMYESQGWSVSGTGDAARMSAVGYWFGSQLAKTLGDTPVGVIHASLGGSEMAAWFPEKLMKKKYPELLGKSWLESKYVSEWVRGRAKRNLGAKPDGNHPYGPGYLYAQGIKPWKHFPVAGVIWYQGESDAEIPDMKQNGALLRDLITSWRGELTCGAKDKMPFIMVQLPRINDNTKLRASWPEFRAMQDEIAAALPAVYSVNTIDLGSTNSDVHPPVKKEVGSRLAATAAKKIYGKDVACDGPCLKSAQAVKGGVLVSFTHAEGLTTTNGQAPAQFELAGADGTFVPATAEIQGDKVLLTAPGLKGAPMQVRYAWSVFVEPNLVNKDALPARAAALKVAR